MKDRLLQALKCSIGVNLYGDFPADIPREDKQGNFQSGDTRICRDITDALVKKATEGDTAAVSIILQIAEFERPDPSPAQ